MDLPKVAIFSIFREENYKHTEDTDLYCEVVLLDRTYSPTHPLLYQIHVDAFAIAEKKRAPSWNKPSLQQHAELISCEVLQINRQKKEILLIHNGVQKTLHYKNLAILNGSSNDSMYGCEGETLATIYSTLQDALKIRIQLQHLPSGQNIGGKLKATTPISLEAESLNLLKELLQNQPQFAQRNTFTPSKLIELQT